MGKGLFSATEVLAQVEAALVRSKRLGREAQRVVRQAMAYIHEHYMEPVSREVLAQRVGLSVRHLNRCFQQETGVALMTYLNRYRIQQAKGLLEGGSHTVAQVAMAVGFSDSSHFISSSGAARAESGILVQPTPDRAVADARHQTRVLRVSAPRRRR